MRHKIVLSLLIVLFFALGGCSASGPTPIIYGTDLCDYCDMTIADKAFGSELVTKKGKVFKFDSIECLAAAEAVGDHAASEIDSRWVTDFHNAGIFLNSESALLVASDRQKSPMGVGLVAVADRSRADQLIAAKGGKLVNWEETMQLVVVTWKLGRAR
ncbi:MAG: nitrous oxide reductase accessory protein NosL [candidate division Zixibacteria bacterium]|nr:nitrous oxide reductase accessory protein NosL [candidate division Zixibacteria bacterium]